MSGRPETTRSAAMPANEYRPAIVSDRTNRFGHPARTTNRSPETHRSRACAPAPLLIAPRASASATALRFAAPRYSLAQLLPGSQPPLPDPAAPGEVRTARRLWDKFTEGSRRLAVQADSEQHRRHPDQKIQPLQSAEPGVSGEPLSQPG